MLPVPRYWSGIEGISVIVQQQAVTLADVGRGEHLIEPWFWEIWITNESNAFCPIGHWLTYVVQGVRPTPVRFELGESNADVCLLWPGDVPKAIIVNEETVDDETGVFLMIIYERPLEGVLTEYRGLHRYQTA